MLIRAAQVRWEMRRYGHGKPPGVTRFMASALFIRLTATLGPITPARSRAYDAVARDPVQ